MLDAEIAGVARLEAVAFAADAVAEQRLVADRRGDRRGLFVAYGIHRSSPGRWLVGGTVRRIHGRRKTGARRCGAIA